MTNSIDGPKGWQARAAAWELAALSFRYPGAELAGAVASGEWAAAAREIAAALGLALPEGLGEGLSGRSGPGDASAEGLRPEATWARRSRRAAPTRACGARPTTGCGRSCS